MSGGRDADWVGGHSSGEEKYVKGSHTVVRRQIEHAISAGHSTTLLFLASYLTFLCIAGHLTLLFLASGLKWLFPLFGSASGRSKGAEDAVSPQFPRFRPE